MDVGEPHKKVGPYEESNVNPEHPPYSNDVLQYCLVTPSEKDRMTPEEFKLFCKKYRESHNWLQECSDQDFISLVRDYFKYQQEIGIFPSWGGEKKIHSHFSTLVLESLEDGSKREKLFWKELLVFSAQEPTLAGMLMDVILEKARLNSKALYLDYSEQVIEKVEQGEIQIYNLLASFCNLFGKGDDIRGGSFARVASWDYALGERILQVFSHPLEEKDLERFSCKNPILLGEKLSELCGWVPVENFLLAFENNLWVVTYLYNQIENENEDERQKDLVDDIKLIVESVLFYTSLGKTNSDCLKMVKGVRDTLLSFYQKNQKSYDVRLSLKDILSSLARYQRNLLVKHQKDVVFGEGNDPINGKIRNRGFFNYMSMTALTEEELPMGSGKRILDIGGGEGGFSMGLEQEHDMRNCITLDLSPVKQDNKHIKGNAENMSYFPPGHFDLIVAVFSVPSYCKSLESIERIMREVFRVLKAGGEARLTPFIFKDAEEGEGDDFFLWEEFENILQSLQEMGLQYHVEAGVEPVNNIFGSFDRIIRCLVLKKV